ncbi:hypothetical protein [Mycobacterium colombiense]|uniref:hypothetical protein n=1 Tax=Mycobacterium colombiense TaxID=339268 RepID=UPI001152CD5D|nr:hypothetical protein [Mycobacterium colombiense]
MLGADRQALALAQIQQEREGDSFGRAAFRDLYEELALPTPSNIDNTLRSLRNNGWAINLSARGRWRLTPLGKHECATLLKQIGAKSTKDLEGLVGGSLLGQVRHTVVPPTLAPLELSPAIANFLGRYAFDSNVFGMTRFPSDADADPVKSALDAARAACAGRGMTFHLASDRAISDDLWRNVAGHMWACKFGIGIFEDRAGRGLNYNLSIEIGGMIATGRRCLLLKDKSISSMPTDLVGMIYKSVDLDDTNGVKKAVEEWIDKDLRLQ